MTDFLDLLGVSAEERAAGLRQGLARTSKSDRRVCKCGHGARYHLEERHSSSARDTAYAEFLPSCQPGRQRCECKKFDYALTVPDIRLFMFQTTGEGGQHALTKGIESTNEKRGSEGLVWREGTQCDWCPPGTPVPQGEGLIPTGCDYTVDNTGAGTWTVVYGPSPYNYLLCQSHLGSLLGFSYGGDNENGDSNE